MDVDLTVPEEELMGEQRSKTLRLLREYKISYGISRDINDFEYFYKDMFLPYIQGKFVYTQAIMPKSHYLNIFKEGELIWIKKGDQIVAGGLIEYKKDHKAKLSTLGVLNGDKDYVAQGALAALYYYSMVEMKKRGFKRLHLGGARPFFSDGVMKYKASVNGTVTDETNHSCVWLSLLNDSIGLKNFLLRNSFVSFEGRRLCRNLFWEVGNNPQQKEINRMDKDAHFVGCAQTNLFVMGDYEFFQSKIDCSKLTALSVKPIERLFDYKNGLLPQEAHPQLTQAVT
jgi:hypothetical protein